MNLNTDEIIQILTTGEENAQVLDELADNIVCNYCNNLNRLMQDIHKNVIDECDNTTVVIEKYLLLLADEIFWATDKLESAEVRSSIYKAISTEAYNKAYMNSAVPVDGKKATVAELQAIATQNSLNESMTSILQNSVRDRIKGRIDAAQCMHRTLTRILARRQEEQNII